ncbi:MAG: hypothetical protein PVI66_10860 [Candidatus Aminicenantes bacterium]|jgi:hypothetical protein
MTIREIDYVDSGHIRLGELKGPDEQGIWIDKQGKTKISFIKDERGTVRALLFHETIYCPRIDE